MSQDALTPSPSTMTTQAPLPESPKSLVPPQLQWVALTMGSVLFAVGFYLPEQWQPYVAAAGSLAYFLAGLGWKAPAWAPKKPLLPLTLVPMALSGSELVEVLQPSLSENLRPWASLIGGLLALGAGKVMPQPTVVTAPPPQPSGTP